MREQKRTYAKELELLPSVFDRFGTETIPELDEWTREAKDRPVIFVASGGALAVARLAADLHEHATGQIAKALTPLELATAPTGPTTGALLLSSGARHPDAEAAARTASGNGYHPLGLLTLRPFSELPRFMGRLPIQPIVLSSFPGREGFLATVSVLSMATALARSYAGGEATLPAALPFFSRPVLGRLARDAIVLFGPGHACAAVDLETRMSELGLSHVQVTDYRNFAHGRHAGFKKNISETTVVAFVAPPFRELADATVSQLPIEAEVLKIETAHDWPASALDLIVGSMQLTGLTATEKGIEPSRPGVPPFGRRLYHLATPGQMRSLSLGPTERKVLACGGSVLDNGLRGGYELALEEWLNQLRKTKIGGIVLDYDGTCCETSRRFEPTPAPVCRELTRLLDEGCVIGFASGRGKSLHGAVREWVPKAHWQDVVLGLYNGSVVLNLDEDLPDQRQCFGDLAEAAGRLEDSPIGSQMKIHRRTSQVTVEVASRSRISGASLASSIREIIARPPTLELKVVASAHSADIVTVNTGKAAVLEAVRSTVGNGVLTVGDQGHIGGNDFELLAATPLSLSVDRCSADPTRCWNLGRPGEAGPQLLTQYLGALQSGPRGFRFSWKIGQSQTTTRTPIKSTNRDDRSHVEEGE